MPAGANGDTSCPSGGAEPAACLPVQSVTGPDGHTYRIDTYVNYVNNDATLSVRTPTSGLTLKRVTIVVRDGTTDPRARVFRLPGTVIPAQTGSSGRPPVPIGKT